MALLLTLYRAEKNNSEQYIDLPLSDLEGPTLNIPKKMILWVSYLHTFKFLSQLPCEIFSSKINTKSLV